MPIIAPEDMIQLDPIHGWRGQFFHSENMTVGRWEIAADAGPVHEHHHPNEEVWCVIEGELLLLLDGVEHLVRAGSSAIVPLDVVHAVRPVGACSAVVVDFPVRLELPGMLDVH